VPGVYERKRTDCKVLPKKREKIARPMPRFFANGQCEADKVRDISFWQIPQDVLIPLAVELGDMPVPDMNIQNHYSSPSAALLGKDVFDRPLMARLDQFQVITCGFQQADEC
jgi:hypothetical protein